MNNFETGGNGFNGDGENNSGNEWDILGREDVVTEFQKQLREEAKSAMIRDEVEAFEEGQRDFQERVERIKRERLERLEQRQEAKDKMKAVSRKLLAVGIVAVGITAGIIMHNLFAEPEFMEKEGAMDRVSPVAVETVVFSGGPNLRNDPAALGGERSNLIMDMGNEDQKITLADYDGEAMFLRKENDPNGNWWGFKADELADAFQKNSFMKKGDANKIRKDKDGYVWVNSKYVDVTRAEESSVN